MFSRESVTVMGILNLTPDSFSDGGRFVGAAAQPDFQAAIAAARAMVDHGADVLDVGGESTRPGALEIPEDQEIERTIPLVAALVREVDVPISIDTRKSGVAAAAVEAGARIINDVSGLGWDPALAEVAAGAGATLILGHLRGVPETMQRDPHFDDVLVEVADELLASVEAARAAGVPDSRLVIDPGIGFGKQLEDNLRLVAHAGWLRDRLGLPLMIGASRKGFLGEITGDPVDERDTATQAACAVAAFAGADAVRVHDVAGAVRAVAVGGALRRARRKELS